MKIAVRYYSKTGNTEKLAKAIAEAVGVEALSTDSPLKEPVDLLFLGSSVYAAGVAQEVKDFIAALDRDTVGQVAAFSTAALLSSTYKQIAKLLAPRNIPLSQDEFHCRGRFHAAHKDRPNAADLAAAAAFARRVAGLEG